MRFSSDLGQIARCWLTTVVGILATVVSIAWWMGQDISLFVSNDARWYLHPWQLVTSIFPHVDIMHLFFNLYWLWSFGSFIERRFGPVRTTGIYLLLAVGSSLAEYAFGWGGVGLSGVGYGLFGLLLVVRKHDPFLAHALNKQTIFVFVVWFFLCIGMTYAKYMAVGNFAHGGGLAFGLLLGTAITWQKRRRAVVVGTMAVLMLSLAVLSFITAQWKSVPLSQADQFAYEGYVALTQGENQKAVDLLNGAIKIDDHKADYWYNLGVGYGRLHRTDEAIKAFKMAYSLKPPCPEAVVALDGWLRYKAANCTSMGQDKEAAALIAEADDLMNTQSPGHQYKPATTQPTSSQ